MMWFSKKNHYEKEWDKLIRKEERFLYNREDKKETKLNKMLEEKVPDKLQETLDKGFEKAFKLIFEKGTSIIEKTYNKDKLKQGYEDKMATKNENENRKSLKAFSKGANLSKCKNIALSGSAGIGMGLIGVGIPDIPVFTAMLLKNLYETAIHYGFEYKSTEEKYFILLLIEGAVSYGDHCMEVNRSIERFMFTGQLPEEYIEEEQIKKTSNMLSKELLYMKFLQGIPIVGAVGGAYDIAYMKQVGDFAKMKYYKRFLMNEMK